MIIKHVKSYMQHIFVAVFVYNMNTIYVFIFSINAKIKVIHIRCIITKCTSIKSSHVGMNNISLYSSHKNSPYGFLLLYHRNFCHCPFLRSDVQNLNFLFFLCLFIDIIAKS